MGRGVGWGGGFGERDDVLESGAEYTLTEGPRWNGWGFSDD